MKHKIYEVAKLLKLSVKTAQEPTTGYWFAYIGHDDGKYTSANTACDAVHKTEKVALDDLLLIVRDLIDGNGDQKEAYFLGFGKGMEGLDAFEAGECNEIKLADIEACFREYWQRHVIGKSKKDFQELCNLIEG